LRIFRKANRAFLLCCCLTFACSIFSIKAWAQAASSSILPEVPQEVLPEPVPEPIPDAIPDTIQDATFDEEASSPTSSTSSLSTTSTSSTTATNPDAQFVKPPGPARGGVIKAPHPYTSKGLIRIEDDGTYIYKTKRITKTHSVAVKVGPSTPPKIQGPRDGVDFSTVYGGQTVTGVNVDYEWQALKAFGSLGLQFGGGLITVTGQGFLASGGRALEKYTLYMLPLTGFVIYRFEYSRKQWLVPYLLGGGSLVGLVETRDDNKRPGTAVAPAVGGAAGFHLSLTKLDSVSAFELSEEFGVADLWLTVEGRVMQGLRADVNYTTQMLSAGITMDF